MGEKSTVTVKPTDLSAYEVFRVGAELGNHVTIAIKSTFHPACKVDARPRWSIHLMIWGDFGPWEHYWSHCGSKDEGWWNWLESTDRSYWMGKMVPGDTDELDWDASVKNILKELYQMRRRKDLTKDEFRDAVERMQNFDERGLEGFVDRVWTLKHKVTRYSKISFHSYEAEECIFDEPWAYSVHRPKPRLVWFWQHVWRPFIEQAKATQGFKAGVAA